MKPAQQVPQHKIDEINRLIAAYFAANPQEATTKARQLEEFSGRGNLPKISEKSIRGVLRKLAKSGKIGLIHGIILLPKTQNTYWFFTNTSQHKQ